MLLSMPRMNLGASLGFTSLPKFFCSESSKLIVNAIRHGAQSPRRSSEAIDLVYGFESTGRVKCHPAESRQPNSAFYAIAIRLHDPTANRNVTETVSGRQVHHC